MRIYLLRHGLAEDAGVEVPDEDRRLTDEGRERLARAGRTWRRLVQPPDLLLVSPLRRARETAELFAEAVGFTGEPRVEQALVPSAAPSLALALLEAELLSGTSAVAIVGHEPHLGILLASLLTGHPRLSAPLKKGMLVALATHSSTNVIAGLRFVLSQKAAAQLA